MCPQRSELLPELCWGVVGGGLHHLMMRRMVDGANNYGTNPVVPAGKSKAPRIKSSRGKAPDSEEGTRRTSERRCGGTSSVSSQVSAPPLLFLRALSHLRGSQTLQAPVGFLGRLRRVQRCSGGFALEILKMFTAECRCRSTHSLLCLSIRDLVQKSRFGAA